MIRRVSFEMSFWKRIFMVCSLWFLLIVRIFLDLAVVYDH